MTRSEISWTLMKLQGLLYGTMNTDDFPQELYNKIEEATK